MTKTVYHYDRDTFVYLGAGDAMPSPVRPDTYLPIAFSTDKAPPTAEAGQVVVFDEALDEWVQVLEGTQDGSGASDPVQGTPEERKAALLRSVDLLLDAQAQALGYASILTGITYADEPAVAKFQREGQALRAWRSLVYARCYEVVAEVAAGERQEPTTAAELYALLPAFELPVAPAEGSAG